MIAKNQTHALFFGGTFFQFRPIHWHFPIVLRENSRMKSVVDINHICIHPIHHTWYMHALINHVSIQTSPMYLSLPFVHSFSTTNPFIHLHYIHIPFTHIMNLLSWIYAWSFIFICNIHNIHSLSIHHSCIHTHYTSIHQPPMHTTIHTTMHTPEQTQGPPTHTHTHTHTQRDTHTCM